MKARFVRYEWENSAKTIASMYFKPDHPYYFTAGQYAGLTIPHDNPDNRGLTRTMSFTSKPSDPLIKMTMLMPKRPSTYKKALLKLLPGDPVTLTDAMGDLVLPLDNTIPLVFVAGGVAIASYVSMILWLTEQKDARDITLLYAVRDTDDIIYQEVFDAYANVGSLHKVLFTTDHKIEAYPWQGELRKSRLTSTAIIDFVRDNSMIYVSGAEDMVNQLQQELQHKYHLPQYRLAFDYFEGYAATQIPD